MPLLNVEVLLQTARDRTGLSDFGPADFREGLEMLVNGINREVEVAPDRAEALRERFLRLLCNRLWFAQDLADHPEILDQEIVAPIIISSLPRTASTKLHRMLGASGDFQFTPMWLGLNFARRPGQPCGGRDARIAEGHAYEKWMYATAPETINGHAMFAEEPEEDLLLGEFTLRHTMLIGMFDSPTYAQWVMQADPSPTYDYLLLQIKYLQWQTAQDAPQDAAKPWLNKTPCHFGNEAQLQRIYGKPRFIVTHRDPGVALPSIFSVAVGTSKLYSDKPSDTSVIAGVSQLFAQCTVAHMKWRERAGEAQILDLSFNDINARGMDTMQKVYDHFGMTLSAQAEARMRAWEQINFRGKHSKGVYTIEDDSADIKAIRDTFKPYIERFSSFM